MYNFRLVYVKSKIFYPWVILFQKKMYIFQHLILPMLETEYMRVNILYLVILFLGNVYIPTFDTVNVGRQCTTIDLYIWESRFFIIEWASFLEKHSFQHLIQRMLESCYDYCIFASTCEYIEWYMYNLRAHVLL